MAGIGDWSGLYRNRERVKALYPSVWKLPIVKKELDRLLPNIKDGSRILEVGAGDRRFESKIKARISNVAYKSMDIDRSTAQDYYSLSEIDGQFDFIFLFEVIEHLTPDEGLSLLAGLHGLLAGGGTILVGTPNLYHPHRYFGDITHKTPYKYEELGAVLLMAGFKDPRFYRIYNDSFIKRALRLSLGVWLHRYLDVDFAGTILAEARV